ncbi:MAG: dephospho-CoA kinase [Paracoccus sp. (in: a-proteobacteria)]
MSFLLGLTGSIGMGKSTTAQMFRDLGHPVWDADAAVHRLYAPQGAAVDAVAAAFPSARNGDVIDRDRLKTALAGDPSALARLETIVHPLVAKDRDAFLAAQGDAPLIVLDIPLLFESSAPPRLDGIAVVTTDPETQRARVLSRPGITAETLQMILARQMPDAEKRARANWIIPTDSLDAARQAVNAIITEVTTDA